MLQNCEEIQFCAGMQCEHPGQLTPIQQGLQLKHTNGGIVRVYPTSGKLNIAGTEPGATVLLR